MDNNIIEDPDINKYHVITANLFKSLMPVNNNQILLAYTLNNVGNQIRVYLHEEFSEDNFSIKALEERLKQQNRYVELLNENSGCDGSLLSVLPEGKAFIPLTFSNNNFQLPDNDTVVLVWSGIEGKREAEKLLPLIQELAIIYQFSIISLENILINSRYVQQVASLENIEGINNYTNYTTELKDPLFYAYIFHEYQVDRIGVMIINSEKTIMYNRHTSNNTINDIKIVFETEFLIPENEHWRNMAIILKPDSEISDEPQVMPTYHDYYINKRTNIYYLNDENQSVFLCGYKHKLEK